MFVLMNDILCGVDEADAGEEEYKAKDAVYDEFLPIVAIIYKTDCRHN